MATQPVIGNPWIPAAVPLTPKQIESVLQQVAFSALGIDPTGVGKDAAYAAVRTGWASRGQPAFSQTDDVMMLRCYEVDDDYDKIRDMTTTVLNSTQLEISVFYTRVWECAFTLYGPNSFDRARLMRSGLLSIDQTIHDLLVSANLYLMTSIEAPRRVPEPFGNTGWWERVDLTAKFYEFVTEQDVVNSVASVETPVYTDRGKVADVTTNAQTGYGIGLYGVGPYGG